MERMGNRNELAGSRFTSRKVLEGNHGISKTTGKYAAQRSVVLISQKSEYEVDRQTKLMMNVANANPNCCKCAAVVTNGGLAGTCRDCHGTFHPQCGLPDQCFLCINAEYTNNPQPVEAGGRVKCCGCGHMAYMVKGCVSCKGKCHGACGDHSTCRICLRKQETEALVGVLERATNQTQQLVREKYTYKRKAEEVIAENQELQQQLAVAQNEVARQKQKCENAVIVLSNAASRVERLMGMFAEENSSVV